MNRKLLYKFFDGTASTKEKEDIKMWLESAQDNRDELLNERAFYDALVLSGQEDSVPLVQSRQKRRIYHVVFVEFLKIAAVILFVAGIGFYFHQNEMGKKEQAINTLIIPAGQRANLILPDGTNVWLNARTQIKYPAVFSDSRREVELIGEAYFEVTHSDNIPFIVHTRDCDVEVLGTKFNVEAYGETPFFSTALMEGSVKVIQRDMPENSITLTPHQKVNLENGILITSSIEDYDPYRWREGLICFKNEGFMDLMKRFEKCYGIDIIVENEQLSKHVFSGKFRISDGIDNALRVLQKEARYNFTRSKDDSVIYIK